MLRKFEQELLRDDWEEVHKGLEVKKCATPGGDRETFILCRSVSRKEKDRAIIERFTGRIEAGLEKNQTSCRSGRIKNISVAKRRFGRLLQRNSRAAGIFDIKVVKKQEDNRLTVLWRKVANREN